MSDTPPDPEKLSALGKRINEAQRKHEVAREAPPPAAMGIALRFSTEMVAALAVGAGLGWGIDWLFGKWFFVTKPTFFIILLLLGAAAGIRNVVNAAKELNAQAAAASAVTAPDDDEES